MRPGSGAQRRTRPAAVSQRIHRYQLGSVNSAIVEHTVDSAVAVQAGRAPEHQAVKQAHAHADQYADQAAGPSRRFEHD